jgi:hypothetical protein
VPTLPELAERPPAVIEAFVSLNIGPDCAAVAPAVSPLAVVAPPVAVLPVVIEAVSFWRQPVTVTFGMFCRPC